MWVSLFILRQNVCDGLFAVWVNRLDGAVLVVGQLGEFDAAFVVSSAGQGAVMVEEVPFVPELNNGVMGRPADNRCQNRALELKWARRTFTRGIDDFVRRSGGVR